MTSNLAIDYGAGLSDAWSSIATFVPKLVAFLVILFIGWIVAKVLAKIVSVVLKKVGFDRLAERSGVQGALAKGDYDATKLLSKVVYYAILLIALQLAIGVFGPNPIADLLSRFVSWLPKLFIAILIIVIVAAIAKAVKELVRGALGGASYGPVLATVASLLIWGAGIIAALNQIGVATTVTTPILITVLATIGGVVVVGVGGGLVRPMQSRWDGWLTKVAEEIPARRAERQAAVAAQTDARARAEAQAQQAQAQYVQAAQEQARGQVPGRGQHAQHERADEVTSAIRQRSAPESRYAADQPLTQQPGARQPGQQAGTQQPGQQQSGTQQSGQQYPQNWPQSPEGGAGTPPPAPPTGGFQSPQYGDSRPGGSQPGGPRYGGAGYNDPSFGNPGREQGGWSPDNGPREQR